MYLMLSMGTSDDLPHAHARSVLVHPARADFMDGGARDTNLATLIAVTDPDAASRLEVGRIRLAYALIWALVSDQVKLLAYRILILSNLILRIKRRRRRSPKSKTAPNGDQGRTCT